MIALRLLSLDDTDELADLAVRNRGFMAPTEPHRDGSYFTRAGQEAVIAGTLAGHATGTTVPWVITDENVIVGRITLNNIVRGPLQSASVGYWISKEHNGRGIATAATGLALEAAFGELGLHRVEAGTLVDNLGSQRVLAKAGFVRYGLAPKFLLINGEWRDHVLFQRLSTD
ncbi:MAG TPA: GNAT family protein [Marmoricola sp.]|jgi:ribosomal-protein-alanine N-acetyltransferase|nr:GNAT family protein [Marmoricola sp.]